VIRFACFFLNLLNNRSPRPRKTQPPHRRPLLLEPLESRAVPASVTDYGAVGDGSHDDTAAFQAAIDNAPRRGIVDIPAAAVAYRISNVLTISRPVTIRGLGSAPLMKMASLDTAMFYVYSSNVIIKNLTLDGFQSATFQPNALGIWCGGAPRANLSFTNLVLKHWEDGIGVSHASNAKIANCTISDIVYAGVEFDSVTGGVITNNTISNCHGDTLGHPTCYGIAVSRNVGPGELTSDPNSSNVTVSNNTISDVAWEGIDTHGGQNLSFIGNKLYRCLNGIAVMSSTNFAGTYVYPPVNCTVDGNIIDSQSVGLSSWGIYVNGGIVGHFSTGTILRNNQVTGHGGIEGVADGGIEIDATDGIQISNNTITSAALAGITAYSHNTNMNVSDNIIVAPWALTGYAPGIYVASTNNTGVFSGNQLKEGSLPDGCIGFTVGIYVADYASNLIGIGPGNKTPAGVPLLYDPGSHTYTVP
jgi:parallel beta-helix repeat protein